MGKQYFRDRMDYDAPEPHHRLCAQIGAVTLQQRGKNNFAVRYGMKVKAGLTYGQAAAEFGACIMHELACEQKLDNRMPGEV